jgi:hypothetical protein
MFKKILPSTLILTLALKSAYCQNDEDTLSKYSYQIVGVHDSNNALVYYPLGTGFFLRTSVGIYFVTAKHALTQKNTFNPKMPLPQFDTIAIWINRETRDTSGFRYLTISEIKKALPDELFYNIPDMYSFKLWDTEPPNYQFNSLERIIRDTPYNCGIPSEIIVDGYGSNNPDTLKVNEALGMNYYRGTYVQFTGRLRPYPNFDAYSYASYPEFVGGLSGSPVFFKYSENKNGVNREWIKFGGIAVEQDTVPHFGYAIKPDTVLFYILHPQLLQR